jgi:hypothetical protein
MKDPVRRIASCAFLLVVGGLLASCGGGDGDGGGGGNQDLRLFFGQNGEGSCSNLVIEVDVDDAGAELSRTINGTVDCDLNSTLDGNGCDVDFAEIEDGDTLRVTISGCTIPAVSSLFSCQFDDVDLSELREQTSAQCSCSNAGCDASPPICVARVQDPGACEDCNNARDDDDNGLIDCQDPNCEHSPLCGNDGTTTTTVDRNTTTTTIEGGTTTTSTTLPATQACELTFRLNTNVAFGALTWDTDYRDAPGAMRGIGDDVQCSSLVSGISVFNDKDGQKVLSSGVVSATGIQGPVDLSVCKFDASSVPAKADFDITITEAIDPDDDPIQPLPSLVIKTISCVPITTTTTDGIGDTTTTTLVGETTTTIENDTTTTLGPTTTTTTPIREGFFDIHFRVTSASAPINALQFSVNYAAAPGGFEGTGGLVSCTNDFTGESLFAPNDEDAEEKLTVGLITVDGITATTAIATCTFQGDTLQDVPVPANFVVTIDDATDENEQNVTTVIDVTVTQAHL